MFETSTLCVNYFSSLLGPTYPNRFYLVGGTSGGITTNGVDGYGVLDYPMILDLLENAGVSWKVYNIGFDNVPQGYSDNVFVFFKRWARDPRTRASRHDYHEDIQVGMRIQHKLIHALQNSSAWRRSAYILTYDENGGYFDHSTPVGPDNEAASGMSSAPPPHHATSSTSSAISWSASRFDPHRPRPDSCVRGADRTLHATLRLNFARDAAFSTGLTMPRWSWDGLQTGSESS